MDPLEARNLFPLAEHHIHMNHAGVSPMSRRTRAAIEQVVVLRELSAAQVIARTHQDFVRLSPHFHNTDEEVDRVLDVLSPERLGPQ